MRALRLPGGEVIAPKLSQLVRGMQVGLKANLLFDLGPCVCPAHPAANCRSSPLQRSKGGVMPSIYGVIVRKHASSPRRALGAETTRRERSRDLPLHPPPPRCPAWWVWLWLPAAPHPHTSREDMCEGVSVGLAGRGAAAALSPDLILVSPGDWRAVLAPERLGRFMFHSSEPLNGANSAQPGASLAH